MLNTKNKTKVAIIGAGPMGLMSAYELLKQGYEVHIYERDDRIGGMSASFDFDGTKIERFYHFICKPDKPLFNLLEEFNLMDKLSWRNTKMGFYYEGKLYQWGSLLSLLKFPELNFITKFRYGLMSILTCSVKNWDKLDKVYVTSWLKQWLGEKGYEVLWSSLFYYKFYEYKDELSAAWLGTRIQRVGKSRDIFLRENLGFLQGGSDTLLTKIEKSIIELGGKITLRSNVEKINTNNNQITGIQVNGDRKPYDAVISTIPLPYLPRIFPELPNAELSKLKNIINVGVRCIILKLQHSFSPYFWMNINDKDIQLPGIIQYSNLNYNGDHIVYIPYYMPQTHIKYHMEDKEYITEAKNYLTKINPKFNQTWIKASRVARYDYAQTVCPPGFMQQLPPMQSNVKNFYLADTSYYYPEDRSISESVKVGKKLANILIGSYKA